MIILRKYKPELIFKNHPSSKQSLTHAWLEVRNERLLAFNKYFGCVLPVECNFNDVSGSIDPMIFEIAHSRANKFPKPKIELDCSSYRQVQFLNSKISFDRIVNDPDDSTKIDSIKVDDVIDYAGKNGLFRSIGINLNYLNTLKRAMNIDRVLMYQVLFNGYPTIKVCPDGVTDNARFFGLICPCDYNDG